MRDALAAYGTGRPEWIVDWKLRNGMQLSRGDVEFMDFILQQGHHGLTNEEVVRYRLRPYDPTERWPLDDEIIYEPTDS